MGSWKNVDTSVLEISLPVFSLVQCPVVQGLGARGFCEIGGCRDGAGDGRARSDTHDGNDQSDARDDHPINMIHGSNNARCTLRTRV